MSLLLYTQKEELPSLAQQSEAFRQSEANLKCCQTAHAEVAYTALLLETRPPRRLGESQSCRSGDQSVLGNSSSICDEPCHTGQAPPRTLSSIFPFSKRNDPGAGAVVQ